MVLNGVYIVDGNADVHLIELTFDSPPESVDVGQITQAVDGLKLDSWQSPWEEKYLDETGEKVIGDYFDVPKEKLKTRLLFYFHFLDLKTPLLTQFGKLSLTIPTVMPTRLKGLIEYVEPD